MPTYEYQCSNCQQKSEIFQKISDLPVNECPLCQQPGLIRGPGGGIGIAFKGPGFFGSSRDAPAEISGGCCPCGKNNGSCASSIKP